MSAELQTPCLQKKARSGNRSGPFDVKICPNYLPGGT